MESDCQIKNLSAGIYCLCNLGCISLCLSYVICKMGNNDRTTSYGYIKAKQISIQKVLRMGLEHNACYINKAAIIQ